MGLIRKLTIVFLFAATSLSAATISTSPVYAKDGGGSDGGGSGSGSSGHGGGDDGGGDDHDGHNGDDGHGGRGGGDDDAGKGGHESDYDRARDGVRRGEMMSLKSLLQKLDAERLGRVIDIRLSRSSFRDIYQVKLRDRGGVIRTFRVDARSGAVIGRN